MRAVEKYGNTMKKSIFVFTACIIILTLTGCQPIMNHGVLSADPDSASLITITFERYVITESIDNADLDWESNINGKDVVQIDSGAHSFGLLYHDNQGKYTQTPQTVTALFEAGKSYKVVPVVSFMEVHFDVINEATQESVLVDIKDSVTKAETDYLPAYIASVIAPVGEPVTGDDGTASLKTVIEEGDDFILYDEPDMRFTFVDKKSGEVKTGHRTFIPDFTMTGGTVYLKFDDGSVTKEAFLESNFQETSDIVLIVTGCDKKTVTYTYIKPDDLKGKVITLTITQKD